MVQLNRLVWAEQRTYQFGPLHLGVRASDPGLSSALEQALKAHLVPNVVAPHNYSILVPQGKQMGTLHRGHVAVVRTVDTGRLLWATIRHFSSHVESPNGLALDLGAVIRGDKAVLAPHGISALPRLLSRDLQQAGHRFLDAAWVDVDLERGVLFVAEPSLDWDPNPLREEMKDFDPVQPGVYKIAGIVAEIPPFPQTPSTLFWTAQTLRRARDLPTYGPERAIDQLADFLDGVPLRWYTGGVREVAAAVSESFDGIDR